MDVFLACNIYFHIIYLYVYNSVILTNMVIIIGGDCALGTVCTEGPKWLEEIGVNMRIGHLQKIAPLVASRILQRVHET